MGKKIESYIQKTVKKWSFMVSIIFSYRKHNPIFGVFLQKIRLLVTTYALKKGVKMRLLLANLTEVNL